jgi:hypothetical protein
MPSANIKVGSLWKPVQGISVKVSSSWQAVKSGWVKTVAGWKQFFASALTPSIESQVLITKTLQTDNTYTLSGTNYHWIDYNTLTYYFEYSTDQVSWSTLSTGTPTNPGSGSSNTQGPISVDNLYINAGTNYFRYRVYAVNSTYSTSANSTSSSTIIYGPAKPTISSVSISGSGGTYSGTVSWGSATNASSYRVYFPDGSTVDTSSTSATKSFTGSPSRAFSGSIISSSVSGYYGPLSDAYNASTPANPQLSDPTGIMVWTYNPYLGTFTINWNSVSNATSYDWTVQSTDSSYFNSGTVYTNSFTITGGISGSYPNEVAQGVPNNKTLIVKIQAKASGYTSSNQTQMSPNYSTGDLPARPSNFSVSTTSNSLTVNSFTGGSTYKVVYLYNYASIFSDVSYYASSLFDVTTTQTFTSLPAGIVWEPRVWGTSLGVASGVPSWYLGSSYIYADHLSTLATTAPGSVVTTVSVSYQLLSSFTARFNWTFLPSSLPTQTQWFWVQYSSWDGSAWVYSSGYFYRVDGSNLSLDPYHSTGRGSISSINGNAVVDRATYWLAQVYSYNWNGSNTSYTYLNGDYVYIP